MDVPHLKFFVDENSLVEGAEKILSKVQPNRDLSRVHYQLFTDGITNKLLGCFNTDRENDVLLIRVYGNKTDLLIDRNAETKNIKILHAAGLAPKLHATFDNGLVYEYVPGETLTPLTCRLENIFVLVARKLADMHSVHADGFVREPALWKHCRKFLSLVPEKFSREEKRRRFTELFPEKPDLEEEFKFLEEKLLNLNSPIVFCHNDLLLGNVIYNSHLDSVTFIDYEYAAYNYQAYDIANHFNEYAGVDKPDYSLFPDKAFQKQWFKIYLKQFKSNSLKGCGDEEVEVSAEEVNTLYSTVEKFTLASHYLWGVWSLVQAEYSSIDFDFVKYSFIRLREYYNRKKNIFSL